VSAGDSAMFSADGPHRYANAGGGPLHLIMVVAEPTGKGTPRQDS
jgi:mannose-6-phosphate isomerase-like protein (cupin superfamily)